MKRSLFIGLLTASSLFAGTLARAETIFLSTQLRPIEEATAVRNVILKDLPAPVEYVVEEPPQFAVRMEAERQAGKHTISLVGALHGELSPIAAKDGFVPLDDLAEKLQGKGMPKALLDLGKLGKDKQQYIPWMQATYVMAANKQALQYLPQGADIDKLTYDQLIEWGRKMQEETGQPRIGFPAGPKGLMARYFQGYFYPSFTGGVVRPFKSLDAAKGWESFKQLWAVVNPNSTNYNFMQEPLLADEVWVAWDHIARLKEAVTAQPDQYVIFPAPAGPKGRGYMPVVAGLAIPQGAPDEPGAKTVIEHLTRPETQILTAQNVGFFPTVDAKLPSDIDPGIAMLAAGVDATQHAQDAVISLLPVGLGDRGGEFNKVYMDTFQRVVIRGEPVADVLNEQAAALSKLMGDAKAPCWAPDAASQGACPVE
ncbi:ABC transporter substrate-binding protein [Phyllobacterium brassicacearum]|uniref:ABC transporter substrate-binding protein n=1 Tax=Phyllobacterium brassicacearum TaxID=314235 RepID=A0A2P7BV75_9HYPH|nr:ABC transporter substrate-binding protein [Phyllobacterium brassicacearum]PSH70359.1 ABC transporter substrate-binding protein [Phyllobacterium brassicacearum]TDQ28055.1 carbohydrate ABC transporter substrate-binding protein (CUT1 family) [Phyllobacterium brassicacearum]